MPKSLVKKIQQLRGTAAGITDTFFRDDNNLPPKSKSQSPPKSKSRRKITDALETAQKYSINSSKGGRKPRRYKKIRK